MAAVSAQNLKVKTSLSYLLSAIRIVIGWHFLYEGIVKLAETSWSAGAYLLESTWWFSGIFKALAAKPFLPLVNFLNIWGLILTGLCLFLGLFTRAAAWAGSALLLLYYLAHPPFTGLMDGGVAEGSYIWVNKNLIEMFVLIMLTQVPVQWMFGADRLMVSRAGRKKEKPAVADANGNEDVPAPAEEKDNREAGPKFDRRTVLKNLIGVPVLGGFAYAVSRNFAYEMVEMNAALQRREDAVTSASTKFRTFAGLSELKEKVPQGKIKNLDVSRLICGGNLLSGIAHSRDLIYVDGLMKKYFTTERVWETFRLCEACGVNSVLVRTDTNTVQLIHKYWKLGGKIQWLAQTKTIDTDRDFTINAQLAMDNGASAIYIQGDNADVWVHEGKFSLFDQWFSRFSGKGIPLGVGAHELDVVKAMEERGYPVDFYMKTIHDNKYWSYQPDEPKIRAIKNNNDNYWCREPVETAAFMQTVSKPWIGFKILAAGAIKPENGFRYALGSGADFLCVGMFDYQVVEDCNVLTDVLKRVKRERKLL